MTEIHDASTSEQWRHVPTSLNPADEGSSGLDIHVLRQNCRCLSGPKFILLHEGQWPVRRIGSIPDSDNKIQVERHTTVVNAGTSLDEILQRYLSWLRLQILITWLLHSSWTTLENLPRTKRYELRRYPTFHPKDHPVGAASELS